MHPFELNRAVLKIVLFLIVLIDLLKVILYVFLTLCKLQIVNIGCKIYSEDLVAKLHSGVFQDVFIFLYQII